VDEERLFTKAQALDIAQKLFDSAALNAVPIGWVRKKEWQGLTETEKEMMWDEAVEGREHFCSQYGDFADAIEGKLKEKNG